MDAQQFLGIWGEISEGAIFKLITALVALAGMLLVVVRLWNAISTFNRNRKAAKLEKSISAMTGVSALTEADIANACRWYLEPNCTSTDPSEEEDLRDVVALSPLFKTIDEHLAKGGERRHVILLADSGMGKTSFCINYFDRERKKKKSKRRRVAIVPLGTGDPIQQIESIEKQNETILFLDALDEDPNAAEDPQARLRQLMQSSARFKNVVVTCRSQFFESDERIPKGSGIMFAGARRAGVSREFPLHKLFLAPFNAEQVKSYLRRSFSVSSWGSFTKRRKAARMVEAIPELSVRPMLLELVPELVRENKEIEQLHGLYEYLLASWLRREREWIGENELRDISIELAVRIFTKQRRGEGDRISAEELEEIARDHNSAIESWKLKSRSLLNRDTHGNFKFAHRSVMEFLVLEACLRGDERAISVEWTDLMKDLLVSLANTDKDSERRTLELLRNDLAEAKIFPLATSVGIPRRLALGECKRIIKSNDVSRRHQRSIPIAWRGMRYQAVLASANPQVSTYLIKDQTHGITWLVHDFSRADREDRLLYQENFTSGQKVPMGVRSLLSGDAEVTYRNPSIEEIITLWQCEHEICRVHGIGKVFDQESLYWLSDRLEDSLLCCSFGGSPISFPELKLLDSRVDGDRSFHVYEISGRYGMINRSPYKAMCAYVLEADEELRL